MSRAPPLELADYRALFQSAPGLYVVVRPDLTIVDATEAVLVAAATTREAIVGRKLFDVLPDLRSAATTPVLGPAGETSLVIHRLGDAPSKGPDPERPAMMSSFVAMASHELRTPLTSLQLGLEMLQRSLDKGRSASPPVLLRMARSLARLKGLVESLLEYARIEGGRVSTQVTTFAPASVLRSVVAEAQALAREKGITLAFSEAGGVPPLSSDAELLRLVTGSLVGNALKFTDRGSVTVTLSHTKSAHRVTVEDSGPGIAPEQRAHIFQPFTHVASVWNKHVPGLGLGLHLVHEMVAALGGTVDYTSELGHGTTFVVTLPPLTESGGLPSQPPSRPAILAP